MDAFETFKTKLQAGLAHLHDPDYRFPADICAALDCPDAEVACCVQSRLLEIIAVLALDSGAPPGSRVRQDYEVLRCRYVLGLSQDETALRMGLSLRSLQRVQREATHALARSIWEQRRPGWQTRSTAREGVPDLPAADAPVALSSDAGAGAFLAARKAASEQSTDDAPAEQAGWHSQLRHEFLSLQQGAPESGADLGEVWRGVVRIAEAAARGRVEIAGLPDAGVRVRCHPAALRQILLSIVSAAQEGLSTGKITLTTAGGRPVGRPRLDQTQGRSPPRTGRSRPGAGARATGARAIGGAGRPSGVDP